MDFIEMNKRLDYFLKTLVCFEQYEFKELTEKTVRDRVMQPKL